MTYDLSDFERQLGEELTAAARRRIEARDSNPPTRRWRQISMAAAAALVVLTAAVFLFTALRPQPAAAHPFKITHIESETHMEIVDAVKDPRAAERQLRDELGIDVEFVALPAPPELVGQIVSAASTGTATAQVVFDSASRAERIILPRTVDGRLTVRYGREAQPGEHYDANITSPVCRELWARTPRQATARVAELSDSIRYDTIDSDYRYASDVTLAAIDPDYRLIDVVFLADDKILVTYAAHLDALGSERPNCGWPAAPSR